MHFSLISFDKTFTQTKILRTTAESQTGYSHVLRSRDQYSPKSDKVDVLPLFLFCIFLILTLVFFLVHLNHLKPQLYCSTFQMIFWQYFSDKAHKFSNIKQYVFLDFRKKMVCRVTHISSVQFSRSVVSDSLWPHELQHARPPCPSPSPGVHSDSRPSSQWCHPAISSSVVPFSSCP